MPNFCQVKSSLTQCANCNVYYICDSAMEYWTNDEDIMSDMLEISDFCNFPQPAPEPSEMMKKLRGKCSIFEDDIQEAEIPEEPQYLPVRGHPLLKNKMKKPGGIPTTKNLRQTEALLREVSGFGYGNDLIEHAFKIPISNSDDEKDPGKMSNLEFNSPTRRKSKGKKSGEEESDSSLSTNSEYMTLSESSICGSIDGPDIHSRKEFPDLK